MPSNHLILCHPLLLLPSISPSIRVFSKESILPIRWPKYWSVSFSISPSNEYSGLICFRMDWFHPLAVQGTLKSLLQHLSGFLGGPLVKTLHFHFRGHDFGLWLGISGASQGALVVKNSPAKAAVVRDSGCIPGKTPWSMAWQPTPGFLPGEFRGQRRQQATAHRWQRVGHGSATEQQPFLVGG